MGKGRDKRKKKEDLSKAAKRAAKQIHKLQKHAHKHDGAEEPSGFNNEESIETTLQRIKKLESKVRTVEEVQNVPPPTPRANVVITAHPERDNELIIFGGEFWNGELTEAYNDLYFYNIKKGTWANLVTALNPAPRSSSQGILYKHFLIIYGGEFVSQTQSQYLHFKDVWRFNVRTSEWEELKTLKGGPPSRSGHRMVMWKRSAVVFGGFYDNAQECRYFNDLWVLSNLEGAGRWTPVKTSEIGGTPHARSGHSMAICGDQLFVYGGYSTEKFNRFKKSEATVHHDLWMIQLPSLNADGTFDGPTPMWQKIRLGGVPPPIRCGVSCAFKDRKMYLFGGVVDIESPGGKMVSTFNNDLFVFHMDTKRFYPVVLRKSTKQSTGGGKTKDLNNLEAQLAALQLKGHSHSSDDESSSSSEEEDEDEQPPQDRNISDMKESFETNRHGQKCPHRRMDAGLVVLGNYLYVYGGQFEAGRREITMSDLFSLNLNKLEGYEVLLSQDLSATVWMGKESESNAGSWESGSTVISGTFDVHFDGDDDEEDEEDAVDFSEMPCEKLLDPTDNGDEAPEAIPAELLEGVTPDHHEIAGAVEFMTRIRGKKGLQVHKAQLLAQLGASAAVPTPQKQETIQSFFDRTQAFWMATAKDSFEDDVAARRLKREATQFARRRFHEAKELLAQLALVEEREQEEAQFFRERREQKEREWAEYDRAQQAMCSEEASAVAAALRGGKADEDEDESNADDEDDAM